MNTYETTGENGAKPSLYAYLKMRGEGQYPTEDINLYAETLGKMNLADLQNHAMDRGIKPSPERAKLQTILLNEFKRVVSKKKANRMSRKLTPEEVKRQEIQRQKSIDRNGFLRTLA